MRPENKDLQAQLANFRHKASRADSGCKVTLSPATHPAVQTSDSNLKRIWQEDGNARFPAAFSPTAQKFPKAMGRKWRSAASGSKVRPSTYQTICLRHCRPHLRALGNDAAPAQGDEIKPQRCIGCAGASDASDASRIASCTSQLQKHCAHPSPHGIAMP